MIALLMGIRRRGSELLGLDQMGDRFRILAVNYVFLMMYYTLEGVFVNTLLYRVTPDMGIVLRYRAVVYVFVALSMNAAAYFTKRFSPVAVIRLGGISYLIMYVVLFFGMDHMDRLMYVVAFFSGCGAGFYWSGHNVLITHYTGRHNRGIGVAILGLIQGIMTLLVPVISGFVIGLLPGNTGYRVMFGLCMAVVLSQWVMQSRLAPVEQKDRRSRIGLALRLIRQMGTCRMMLGFEMVRGFRDGTFNFFLNMVLFQIVTDESLVGINTFFTGLMAILGSWAYGKLAGPGRRVPYMLAATVILTAGCGALKLVPYAPTVVLLSAVNAFLQVFFIYTTNTYSYDVMGQNETTLSCIAEMGGLRETALSLGRLGGLFVVMLFPQTLTGYIQAMCILTASQLMGALLIKLTINKLDREQVDRMSAQG